MVTDPAPQGKAGGMGKLPNLSEREGCNFLLGWPYLAASSREFRLWRKRAFC